MSRAVNENKTNYSTLLNLNIKDLEKVIKKQVNSAEDHATDFNDFFNNARKECIKASNSVKMMPKVRKKNKGTIQI